LRVPRRRIDDRETLFYLSTGNRERDRERERERERERDTPCEAGRTVASISKELKTGIILIPSHPPAPPLSLSLSLSLRSGKVIARDVKFRRFFPNKKSRHCGAARDISPQLKIFPIFRSEYLPPPRSPSLSLYSPKSQDTDEGEPRVSFRSRRARHLGRGGRIRSD